MDTCRSCNTPLPPGYNLGLICSSCVDALRPSGGLKYDHGKLRYDLVPPHAIKAIADVLTYGADKYAPNSWQTVSDGETRYTAAMMRHFEAYRAGEDFDPESGKSHLAHCLCNLTFLLHFQQIRISTA